MSSSCMARTNEHHSDKSCPENATIINATTSKPKLVSGNVLRALQTLFKMN